MRTCVRLLTMALFVTSLSAGSAFAQDVLPGVDLFETPPGWTEFSPALPADFFGPGSDPFVDIIPCVGKSLEQDGPSLGRTSMIWERLATAHLPDPFTSSDTVPIKIIALRLVSIDPIEVTYNGGTNPELWDVEVGLSSIAPQAEGTMTISHEYEEGGTFSADLPVSTRMKFTRKTDGEERTYDPAPMEVYLTPPVPPAPLPAEACWSHIVPFPIVTSGGLTTVNHDINPATPYVSVGPSSNFVANGCGFTAAGERPGMGSPPSYYEKVLDPMTAAWSAHGVQPTNPLDHFKVYDIDPVATALTVTLEDQFDVENEDLERIERFANPVDKNGEGIADPNAHLVWYHFESADRPVWRYVKVSNQFGVDTLLITEPEYLLVPAEKIEAGSEFPVLLDHYKCYKVVWGDAIDLPADLVDQFGTEAVDVREPVCFCNPVSKNDEGIISEVDHLVFYEIVPQGDYDVPVDVQDQFGFYPLVVDSSLWLGVPTEKLGCWVKAPAFDQWGLIGLTLLLLVAATLLVVRGRHALRSSRLT